MVSMASGIAERVERVRLLRQPAPPGELRSKVELEGGLSDIEAIRSWVTAAEGRIVSELSAVSPIPEVSIAEATRSSINAASRTRDRSSTLEHADGFDEALTCGAIVTGHVDALTKAAKQLDDTEQRDELFQRSQILLAGAECSTIDQFRKTLAREVKAIQRDNGMERLARQQRGDAPHVVHRQRRHVEPASQVRPAHGREAVELDHPRTRRTVRRADA